MNCNSKENTLTFDEMVKGWTSFHSFVPEFMVGMNNQFFSFKGGDLYIHHSDDVPRNNFYGVQHKSKISAISNENPSEVKALQALKLEGNQPWEALIKSYISNIDDFKQTTIKAVEFVRKEGMWYAYARRNELPEYTSKSTYGIGVVTSVSPTEIEVNGYSSSLTSNDTIAKGSDLSNIGQVVDSSTSNGNTTIEMTTTSGLSIGDFIIGLKDSRIEGGNLRGYAMRIDLENDSTDKVELFSVNSDVMKSYM